MHEQEIGEIIGRLLGMQFEDDRQGECVAKAVEILKSSLTVPDPVFLGREFSAAELAEPVMPGVLDRIYSFNRPFFVDEKPIYYKPNLDKASYDKEQDWDDYYYKSPAGMLVNVKFTPNWWYWEQPEYDPNTIRVKDNILYYRTDIFNELSGNAPRELKLVAVVWMPLLKVRKIAKYWEFSYPTHMNGSALSPGLICQLMRRICLLYENSTAKTDLLEGCREFSAGNLYRFSSKSKMSWPSGFPPELVNIGTGEAPVLVKQEIGT